MSLIVESHRVNVSWLEALVRPWRHRLLGHGEIAVEWMPASRDVRVVQLGDGWTDETGSA